MMGTPEINSDAHRDPLGCAGLASRTSWLILIVLQALPFALPALTFFRPSQFQSK